MSCTNCFNGCVETTSDQCVKYTGNAFSFGETLNIQYGDTLSHVEQVILLYLEKVLDGTGIFPTIDSPICDLVAAYLPIPATLNDTLTAISKVICDLKDRIIATEDDLATLNADYTIDCLNGVIPSSGTHDVLQATIDELCALEITVTAISDNFVNYYTIAETQAYVASAISSTVTNGLMSNRMVPNTAIEYYGTLSNFDAAGAGLGVWDKVYLCNGNHGTPDKRGRLPVGVTDMAGVTVDPVVAPGGDNPNYNAKYTTWGANSVILTEANLASHKHTTSSIVTDPGHTHITTAGNYIYGSAAWAVDPGTLLGAVRVEPSNRTTTGLASASTGITVTTGISFTGSGTAHSNIPPVLSCYYIMYIP